MMGSLVIAAEFRVDYVFELSNWDKVAVACRGSYWGISVYFAFKFKMA